MSDELRDRIAGILADTYSPGGRGVQFEDVVAAEAIIDHIRTDEAVERVAVSLLHSDWPSDEGDREYHWKYFAESYRDKARAAVDALLGEEN